jgi:hypothetical protein
MGRNALVASNVAYGGIADGRRRYLTAETRVLPCKIILARAPS